MNPMMAAKAYAAVQGGGDGHAVPARPWPSPALPNC